MGSGAQGSTGRHMVFTDQPDEWNLPDLGHGRLHRHRAVFGGRHQRACGHGMDDREHRDPAMRRHAHRDRIRRRRDGRRHCNQGRELLHRLRIYSNWRRIRLGARHHRDRLAGPPVRSIRLSRASCPAGANTTSTCVTPRSRPSRIADRRLRNPRRGNARKRALRLQYRRLGRHRAGLHRLRLCGWKRLGPDRRLSPLPRPASRTGTRAWATTSWARPRIPPTTKTNWSTGLRRSRPAQHSADCFLLFTLAFGRRWRKLLGDARRLADALGAGDADSMTTPGRCWITSSVNTPGTPAQTNPPGFTCALGQNSLFTINKATGHRQLVHPPL